MPKTPQRFPGAALEDDSIVFDDRVTDIASSERGIYRKGGELWARDASGTFNIRQAGAGDDNQYLIFKIDGGLVYDTNGDLAVKESDT